MNVDTALVVLANLVAGWWYVRHLRGTHARLDRVRRVYEAGELERALAQLGRILHLLDGETTLERDLIAARCLCELGRFEEAEQRLAGLSRPEDLHDAPALLADWSDVDAQLALGRGEPARALERLDELVAAGAPLPPLIALTRLRALATLGRGEAELWEGLRALPAPLRARLVKRHANERLAAIAARLLDGAEHR
jgi:hypothetical protein